MISEHTASPFALSLLNSLSECAAVEVVAVSNLGSLLVLIDDQQPALISHERDASRDEVSAQHFVAVAGAERELVRRLQSFGQWHDVH